MWKQSLITLISLSAFATDHFVDPQTGLDTNTGADITHPWKTIPGSRNVGDTSDISTAWGSFSTSSKIPGGDRILIKSGAIFDSNICGRVYISGDSSVGSGYYDKTTINTNSGSRLQIIRNVNWGSGPVVINGTNCVITDTANTPWFFYIYNLAGVDFSGVSGVNSNSDGIILENTYDAALGYYMQRAAQGGSDTGLGGANISYITYLNNGYRLTTTNANNEAHATVTFSMYTGDGIYRTWDGITIYNCSIEGGGYYLCGYRYGEQPGRGINIYMNSNYVHNLGHTLDTTDNTKNGRALVTKSCQLINSNFVSILNEKGEDNSMPLQWTTNAPFGWNGWVSNYNCYYASNTLMGCGNNGPHGVWDSQFYTNNMQYSFQGCVFAFNTGPGLKIYSGAYSLALTNNTFCYNIDNLLFHPDADTDTNRISVAVVNNIFYKPNPFDGNTAVGYYGAWAALTLYSDYNCYIATNLTGIGEVFSAWSAYASGGDYTLINFSYGVNGPGQTSGSWYTFNSWNNDSHSVGTGSAVSTTLPPFTSTTDFHLTSHYPGTFGLDMGAFQLAAAPPPPLNTSIIESGNVTNYGTIILH